MCLFKISEIYYCIIQSSTEEYDKEFVACDRESARYNIENAVCDKEFAPHSHYVSAAFIRFHFVSLIVSK
ncbi:hypothetical protein VspSTUT11_12610 [Vibrio sp. STUT-A11]|nr:hypothetical protein VspSTUT11_12610 [Vibrio sp. STUT-A11]